MGRDVEMALCVLVATTLNSPTARGGISQLPEFSPTAFCVPFLGSTWAIQAETCVLHCTDSKGSHRFSKSERTMTEAFNLFVFCFNDG